MKKIISLTKAIYKNGKNDSSKMKKQTKLIVSLILGIYILFVFANFWGLFITPLKEIGRPEVSMSLMISLISIFLFVTSLTYVANVLYFSNDIENILPFPFKPKEIFCAKLLTVYIYELIISTMFLLPGFIAYGYHMNENIIYYIYSFILLVLLPIVPILIVTAAFVIIMQFFKFIKYKNVFRVITTILILLMVVIFEVNLNSNMNSNGEYSGEYILNMAEDFNVNMPYYLNTAVSAIESNDSLNGIISIVWFSIINIFSVLVVVFTCSKLYLKGVYNNLNGINSSKLFANKKGLKWKSKSVLHSLVDKDIKNLFRNVTFFLQCVLQIFLMPIVMLIMFVTSGVRNVSIALELSETSKIFLGIIIMQFFMLMNYTSVTAVSRDGKNEATYIKTLPINFKKQFYAKTSSGIILGFASLIISILFAYKILELKILEVCILIALGSLLNILQAYLHVLIDLIHPKLYWDTEVAVVKQNINIFYSIIVSFILLLITFFLGNILSEFNLIYFVFSYLIIIICALVILKIFINKYSEKLYDKIN